MTVSANEPMDMDALHAENLSAGNDHDGAGGEGDNEPEDRGDVVSGTEDEEGSGAATSDDNSAGGDENGDSDNDNDIDPDVLAEIAAEDSGGEDDGQSSPAVPASRVGVLARERSVALAISDGIIDGTIDPETIKALGGATAAAKAVVRGEATLDDLGSIDTGQSESSDDNRINMAQAWQEYFEAIEDGDEEAAKEVMEKIEEEQRRLIREEAKAIAEESLKQRDAQTEMSSAEETATAIIARHSELNDEGSLKLTMFRAAVGELQNKGYSLNDAFIQAEQEVFPGSTGSDGDKSAGDKGDEPSKGLSQRELAARLRNAKAANQQPPVMEKGAGMGAAQAQKKISEMTDDEFDSLSEREKARLRGDVVS